MSGIAISAVPFVNGTEMSVGDSEAQSDLQDDIEKAKAPASGSAVAAAQAFAAFPPSVQPIASLVPTNETPQAVPVDLGTDSSVSPTQWSGGMVDVYA